MIFTEQVADFVCKHMSEKPSGLNAELLSTFYDPEVKHVDRAGSSIFVAGSRRRSQVFDARLDSPNHFWRQNIQYKSIRAPVCGTPGIAFLFFLREWTVHPPRLDFGLSQNARGDCFCTEQQSVVDMGVIVDTHDYFEDANPEVAVSLAAVVPS